MSDYTYKLADEGVQRSDGAFIPDCSENRDWIDYEVWLSLGNTPDPEFTPEEIVEQANINEISELRGDLQREMAWLFRMILEVWGVGIDKALWTNADITDTELKAKVAAWKTKLDRLAELGE